MPEITLYPDQKLSMFEQTKWMLDQIRSQNGNSETGKILQVLAPTKDKSAGYLWFFETIDNRFTPKVIKRIRELCGLTQEQAGEVFGVGRNAFYKYEHGEISPSDPTKELLRLALTDSHIFTYASFQFRQNETNESLEVLDEATDEQIADVKMDGKSHDNETG